MEDPEYRDFQIAKEWNLPIEYWDNLLPKEKDRYRKYEKASRRMQLLGEAYSCMKRSKSK